MSPHQDQFSQLLLEADGLLLVMLRHREETPPQAITLLRKKLSMILAITADLDDTAPDDRGDTAATAATAADELASDDPVGQYDREIADEPAQAAYTMSVMDNDTPPFFDAPLAIIDDEDEDQDEPLPQDTPQEMPPADAPGFEPAPVAAPAPRPSIVIPPGMEDSIPMATMIIDDDDVPLDEPLDESVDETPAADTASAADTTAADTPDPTPDPTVGEYIEDTVENPVNNSLHDGRQPTVPRQAPLAFYPDEEELPAGDDTPATAPQRPLQRVFNLNDKFRFRRELFGNSDADYMQCLDMLQAMYTLDEAREYLLGDLNWDPASDDVQAFIERLAVYYGDNHTPTR